jgi:Lrp/AsnC family leucine-responsive transcriptional regulator
MDIIDSKILEILSKKADATATEIGEAVNLSIPAVNKRILRMKQDGVIKYFSVVTDPQKMNKTITAFVFVVIQYGDGIDKLMDYVKNDPDLLECYSVTGEYDYMIKICTRSIDSLEDKILKIKRIKGVMRSHTMISLMERKFSPTILPDNDSKQEEKER